MLVSLEDILLAQQRLTPHLQHSPLEPAPELSGKIWLKLENANRTRSFKIRGALNAILALDETERAQGIIAASSGNHAAAVAYAAQLTGASAQVLMPKTTPKKKVDNVQRYGADAVLYGDNYDQAEAEALRRVAGGGTWVSPYNDPHVIAGAGTIGLEIIEQLPGVRRVIVPVSGGGLIAGIATAIKETNSDIEVVGVNAASAPAMYNVFYAEALPQVWETLAEALSGDIEAGSITVPICKRYVDGIVLVSERQIAAAMRHMLAQGWEVEGGGAVGVAAILHNIIPVDGRETVVVVSGGNVDSAVLNKVRDDKAEPGSQITTKEKATRDDMLNGGELRGKDMSNEDLSDLEFSYLNMEGVNMAGANLRDASFEKVWLKGANLTGADLRGASMDDAKLPEAVLRNANLAEATVTGQFRRADLAGANLRGADFSESDLVGADLASVVAVEADFSKADLTGALLAGADFTDADLDEACLRRADLTEAVLPFADLRNADFHAAILVGAKIYGAKLHLANLSRANLTGASLVNAILAGANLAQSVLGEADLTLADLPGANLRGADLSGVRLFRADMSRRVIDGVQLPGANLAKASLIGASLTNTDFTGANLRGADLSQSDLGGVALSQVKVGHVDVPAETLIRSGLRGATFLPQETGLIHFPGANLLDADLTGANLADAKFDWSTKLPDGSFWTPETDLRQFT